MKGIELDHRLNKTGKKKRKYNIDQLAKLMTKSIAENEYYDEDDVDENETEKTEEEISYSPIINRGQYKFKLNFSSILLMIMKNEGVPGIPSKISNELTDLKEHVLAIKALIAKELNQRKTVASSSSQVLIDTKDLKELFLQFNCAIYGQFEHGPRCFNIYK